jgi:hypothetical protein
MKKHFLFSCLFALSLAPVFAQDVTAGKTQKDTTLYVDKDGSPISEKKFKEKVNKGKHTIVITVKDNTTSLALQDAKPADRRKKAGSKRNK